MTRYKLLYTFVLILVVGCSSSTPTLKTPVSSKQESLQKGPGVSYLERKDFPTYSSTFLVQFDGQSKWNYQLNTRKSSTLRELSLHIDGIDSSKNPGDIRLVTDGMTSWMIGPGTDEQCVQFPNNIGMDPDFIYPESLISMDEIKKKVTLAREEPFSGRDSNYYTAGPTQVGGWKDLNVEFHQEKGTDALLQFAMLATGDDVVFGTGTGTIIANYHVDSLEEPVIEPVGGCEINVPLPEKYTNFVRLPGIASFDSTINANEIATFYQTQLAQANWVEKEAPEQTTEAVVLSYQRDAEEVEIHIEATIDNGSKVKIISSQAQQ